MSYDPEYIGVDNGNVRTKTAHINMGNALIAGPMPPQLSNGNTMFTEGQYYTAVGKRSKYKRDKTADPDTYYLTLLAIASELEYRVTNCLTEPARDCLYHVHLGVGLPFMDLKIPGYAKKFQDYFRAPHTASVNLNGNDYHIRIMDAKVFPQGYASVVHRLEFIRAESKVIVIDIGGWTMGIVPLIDGEPDISVVNSYKYGTIHYYNKVIQELMDVFDTPAEDSDIDGILIGKNHRYIPEEVRLVRETAVKYANQGVSLLHEIGLELKRAYPIFTGGGSLLFRPFLSANKMLGEHEFITDTSANAKGYERLLKAARRRRG